MHFKRKLFGYNRNQINEIVVLRMQANNGALESEEKLLNLLEIEGKRLNEEYRLLSEQLEKARERELEIESLQGTIETLFDVLIKDSVVQSNKVQMMAKQVAAEIIERQKNIKEVAATLDSSISIIGSQILDKMEASKALLNEHVQKLNHLNMKYSVLGQMSVAKSTPATSQEEFIPPVTSEVEKRGLQVVKTSKSLDTVYHKTESDAKPQGLRAIIVDNDSTILTMLRSVLEREGYIVTEASDGNMASNLIDIMEPPDIMILDLMLPYMDGLQLIGKIRGLADWKNIPVIILTAKSSEQEMLRLIEAGADEYMIKPFNIKELVTRVKKVVSRNINVVK